MRTIKCQLCGKETKAAHGKYCLRCRRIIKSELNAKKKRKGGFDNAALVAFTRVAEAFDGEAKKAGFNSEDEMQEYMKKEVRKGGTSDDLY